MPVQVGERAVLRDPDGVVIARGVVSLALLRPSDTTIWASLYSATLKDIVAHVPISRLEPACEHGEAIRDYCAPCGRIHGAS